MLLGPGVLWLAAFMVAPLVLLARQSLQRGSLERGYRIVPSLATYADVVSAYRHQILRSIVYATVATLLALLLGYPLACVIALGERRVRALLIGLVVLPFFTTYLIRTIAWQTVLADRGPVAAALRSTGLLAPDARILGTAAAVVGGLTYELLPFMVLPIVASLLRLDRTLLDAAGDLYARPARGFRHVVLPASRPGVFAGTLLTFVPAAGDFVNAQLLGGPGHAMVGNVIQTRFLVLLDYPGAAALSLVMAVVLVMGVLLYQRALGLQDVVA